MQSNLFVYRESGFSKGYNDKYPPEYLPPGYMALIQNGISSQEKIEKRTGYSLVGDDTGNKRILGLCGITTTAGVKRLYKFHDNAAGTGIRILEWTGSGNWAELNSGTLLTNTDNEVNCVVAENVVYAFDGSSTPVVITPGSPSTVAAAADVNFPKGKFGIWYHNFHFVAGVSGASKNTLYWSDLEDSDDFTNGVRGSLTVNPNDGDEITGFITFRDKLLIFKRNRIWSLSGFGTSTFTVANITEELTGVGTISYRSLLNKGDDIYFLSHIGGTPEIRSLKVTALGVITDGGIISEAVTGTMEALAEGQLDLCVGFYDGRRVYYALPASGQTRNNIVLVKDLQTNGWVKWTGVNVSVFAEMDFSSESVIYFGESQADAKVYKLDSSTNDNGAAIDFVVESRRYGGERPEVKKKWKYLYGEYEDSGDHDLTITSSHEGFTYDSLDTVNLKASEGIFPLTFPFTFGTTDIIRKRSHFGKKTSYYMQLKFANANADEEVVIRQYEVLAKRRGLRDA